MVTPGQRRARAISRSTRRVGSWSFDVRQSPSRTLVVRVHAGREVGLEPATADARRVPLVDDAPVQPDLDDAGHSGVVVDDAGVVHDLGDADDAWQAQKLIDLGRAELGAAG